MWTVSGSFNRTFMELKCENFVFNRTKHQCFNRTFMELKSMRNSRSIMSNNSFNRTFMELKFSCKKSIRFSKDVLIVPLWNWNYLVPYLRWKSRRFNRTFMELKLISNFLILFGDNVLIVPLWNWNWYFRCSVIRKKQPF